MTNITLRQLVKAGACRDQRAEFARLFGRSVVVTEALAIEHANVFDWRWAAHHLLHDAARADFEKVCAPALAKYEKVCDAARAKY